MDITYGKEIGATFSFVQRYTRWNCIGGGSAPLSNLQHQGVEGLSGREPWAARSGMRLLLHEVKVRIQRGVERTLEEILNKNMTFKKEINKKRHHHHRSQCHGTRSTRAQVTMNVNAYFLFT